MLKDIILNTYYKLDLKDAKIEKSSKKRALLVDLEISASGKVINNRIYTPKNHIAGVSTWTKPFKRAILLNHDSSKDPIGRMQGASWESLEDKALVFLKGNYNALASLKRAFDSMDPILIKDTMSKYNAFDPEWPGLGRLIGKARITDQDAIDKFIDERYLTWSAGAATDAMICMSCSTNWFTGQMCEHTIGGRDEDGNPNFFLCGSITGREASVVVHPANDTSLTLSMTVEDHSDGNTTLNITDALNEATVIIPTIQMEKNVVLKDLQDLEISTVLGILSDEKKLAEFADALSGESAFEVSWLIRIHDHLHSTYDYEIRYAGDKEPARMPQAVFKLHGMLHDLSEAKGFRDSLINGELDKFDEMGVVSDKYLLKTTSDSSAVSLPTELLDQVVTLVVNKLKESTNGKEEVEEAEQAAEAAEVVLADNVVVASSVDWELLDSFYNLLLGDKSVTTEAREVLDDKLFCGVNKTLPLVDEAALPVLRTVLEKAKLSSEQTALVEQAIADALAVLKPASPACKCGKLLDASACKLEDLKLDYAKALVALEANKEKLKQVLSTFNKKVEGNVDDSTLKLDALVSWFDNVDIEAIVVSELKVKDTVSNPVLKPVENPSQIQTDHSESETTKKSTLTEYELYVVSKYNKKLEDSGEKEANTYLRSVRHLLPSRFNISNYISTTEE